MSRMDDQDRGNRQVWIDELPSIGDLEYTGLHKDYLTAEIISLCLFWLIAGSGAYIFLLINPANISEPVKWLILILLTSIIAASFFFRLVGFKRKKYALREKDLIYKSGYIWRWETTIPFNRIQHAEVRQGPIERLFGLARLSVFTAGGGASDLSISGLLLKDAETIKSFLLKKTAHNEEE